MKLIKKQRKRPSLLASTSDIAFLLLIFLIVTANLEYNPEITPPKLVNTKEFLITDTKVILIEITSDIKYFIESKKIESSELATTLDALSDDFIFKIYADETVPFSLVALVLQTLQESNKQKVLLMIEKVRDEL